MIEWAIGVGELCAAIVGAVTVSNFIYYNKAQIDQRFANVDIQFQKEVKEIEKSREEFKREMYNRLDNTHTNLQSMMNEFLKVLNDIKDADKDKAMEFIKLLNLVKDELKNDYTSRYNDLLTLINSKASESDFTRLESKFDKLSETLVELKTIIQIQLEDKKEK